MANPTDAPSPVLGIVKPQDEVVYLYADGTTELSPWPPFQPAGLHVGTAGQRRDIAKALERDTDIPHYYAMENGCGYRRCTRVSDMFTMNGLADLAGWPR